MLRLIGGHSFLFFFFFFKSSAAPRDLPSSPTRRSSDLFEIAPGVSPAIAVPAYAGIPVTHRDLATSVTIVTGHQQHTNTPAAVNWEQLAKLEGTLVIMMGVETLGQISQRLLAGGLSPATPAAVIQQGTVPQQKVVTGTIENILERATAARIKSPAVIVIGAVVNLSDPLTWFSTTGPGSAQQGHGSAQQGQVQHNRARFSTTGR